MVSSSNLTGQRQTIAFGTMAINALSIKEIQANGTGREVEVQKN
jgi:hypothetical protein